MTPTSTRAHAALIGLNSVHLYKQAEGAGFLDTLKNFWESSSDAQKGAIIGGGGGALLGGLTAPSGSTLQRALLMGGVGAGIGGGIGYLGQNNNPPSYAGKGVFLNSALPPEPEKSWFEKTRDNPPGFVRTMGGMADKAIDETANAATYAAEMTGAPHTTPSNYPVDETKNISDKLRSQQSEIDKSKAPETSIKDVANAGVKAVSNGIDRVKGHFAPKATPESINGAVDQFKNRFTPPSASAKATPAGINNMVENLKKRWAAQAAEAAPAPAAPAASSAAAWGPGGMFGDNQLADHAAGQVNDWRTQGNW